MLDYKKTKERLQDIDKFKEFIDALYAGDKETLNPKESEECGQCEPGQCLRTTVFNDKYKRAFGKPIQADKIDMGEKVKQFRSILNDD